MFLNIDYAKRAAARENNSIIMQSLEDDDDDDIDYEQLFDDNEMTTDIIPESEIKKPVKRVRFAPIIQENSPTPILTRPPSVRPTFDLEFDFDSLATPSNELSSSNLNVTEKTMENMNWKDAFLSDLHIAKKNKPTIVPSSPSFTQIENKIHEDTLWDFMKESNPELLEKLERTNNDKQKRIDRFSVQQPTSVIKTNIKPTKSISVSAKEGIE